MYLRAAQADLLVGRPLTEAHSRLSLWHDTAGTDWSPRPALPGDLDVDVAIVGAGFTGLWTAYYLAEAAPDLRIAVLEARGGRVRRVAAATAAGARRCSRPRWPAWPRWPAGTPRSPSTARCAPASTRSPGPRRPRASTRSSPRAGPSPWPAARRSGAGPRPRSRTRAPGDATSPTYGCSTRDGGASASSTASGTRGATYTPDCAAHPPRAAGARPGRARSSGAAYRSTSAPGCTAIEPGLARTATATVRARARRPRHRGLHRRAARARRAPWCRSTRSSSPPSRWPAEVWEEIGLRPARDVLRPPAPDHLRPAHGRRPPGLRRPRRAVPLRVAGPPGLRPRRAGVRAALRDPARAVPGAGAARGSPTRGAARWASRATGAPRSGWTPPPGSPGPAGTSATASAPPTWPAAPCATWCCGQRHRARPGCPGWATARAPGSPSRCAGSASTPACLAMGLADARGVADRPTQPWSPGWSLRCSAERYCGG